MAKLAPGFFDVVIVYAPDVTDKFDLPLLDRSRLVSTSVEIGDDIVFCRLDKEQANLISRACAPSGFGYEIKVDLRVQPYTIVRAVKDRYSRFDADSRLVHLMMLSRLLHQHQGTFAVSARTVVDRDGEITLVEPAELCRGVSADAFVADGNDRVWLVDDEIRALRQLFVAFESVKLPARVKTALWRHEFAARTYPAELRWTEICAALEGLTNFRDQGPTASFREGCKELADTVGLPRLTSSQLARAYKQRSKLSHEGLFHLPVSDLELYRALERLLARVVRKAIEEPTYAERFIERLQVVDPVFETIALRELEFRPAEGGAYPAEVKHAHPSPGGDAWRCAVEISSAFWTSRFVRDGVDSTSALKSALAATAERLAHLEEVLGGSFLWRGNESLGFGHERLAEGA